MTEPKSAVTEAGGTAIAAIGALPDVGGFALAGVLVYPADTAERATEAWEALPDTVGIVILSAPAADGLGYERVARSSRLTVVMPP